MTKLLHDRMELWYAASVLCLWLILGTKTVQFDDVAWFD